MNVAACAIPELPKSLVPEAVAVTHLAAVAVRALSVLVEAKANLVLAHATRRCGTRKSDGLRYRDDL